MNKPKDLPPLANEEAPRYDKKIDKELKRLGDFDGIPWFCIVWGSDALATRLWAGERYFKYRSHVVRDLAWGVPKYDLAGQFNGYEKVYRREDVIPMTALLDQVVVEKEIALPRFFIEIATWYSEDDWNAQRYLDEHGQVVIKNGKPVDFIGPYPPGGFDYEMLWLCAAHDRCCVEVSETNNIGRRDDGKRCYGHRRLPNMNDVQNIANRVQYFKKVKGEVKPGIDQAAAAKATAQNALDVAAYWEKFERDIAEDNYHVLLPRLKRLTSEGSGLDLQRYVDFAPAIEKHEAENGQLITKG